MENIEKVRKESFELHEEILKSLNRITEIAESSGGSDDLIKVVKMQSNFIKECAETINRLDKDLRKAAQEKEKGRILELIKDFK